LLYPFKTTVVPDWKVRIVDEAGNPMRSFRVREVWQHYTIESTSHQEDLITDGDGYVTFPKRTVRGSLLVRIGRPMVNVLNPFTRIYLAVALIRIQPNNQEALGSIGALSKDPNVTIRRLTLWELKDVGREAKPAEKFIRASLGDSDEAVRAAAAQGP
jgi:hypothetical protein